MRWRTADLEARTEAASEGLDRQLLLAQQGSKLGEVAMKRRVAATLAEEPGLRAALQAVDRTAEPHGRRPTAACASPRATRRSSRRSRASMQQPKPSATC